jgi:hypothetical protein
LPHGSQNIEKEAAGFGDLAVVLGVTGDDEAARLVAGISLNQMIRVSENGNWVWVVIHILCCV